jgi:predicted small secreted protein
MRLIACALIAATLLAGCENKGLRQVTARGDGPDEFVVVAAKPLEQPENLSVLPEPTTGGFNRSDQRPLEDVVAKLGGQRESPKTAVPKRDAALVNHASRFGLNADIRVLLAQADADFRRRQGRFAQIQLFPEDRYRQAYRREVLNAGATARMFRKAGIPTPTAPPSKR